MKGLFAISALAGLAASAGVSNSSAPYPTTTATITYLVYDPECACHRTSTAVATIGTGTMAYPASTYTWWETECGCHKTAIVPVPSAAPASNYSAPVSPPAISASPTPPTTSSPPPEAYVNGAAVVSSSFFGMLALLAFAFA
ncbi:hypothetical protein LTR53_013787 [Teratosphaeriaceae sp. CCFEE 6253]|nr:hypothetical protein LTR53_013787 [Teratosphaeriaceae sp. CCFEE 6253]